MPNKHSIAELLRLIGERHSFVVTSHARPDGDAIGSAVGLMHLLQDLGKQVTVCFADPIPHAFSCLPGVERILHELPATSPDAVILLECDRLERTGFALAHFQALNAGLVLNIDHHLSGRNFADFNWIDPSACAVGAMVYELVIASGTPLTSSIAGCLYAAVLTDTGSFTYASTTAATFGIAQHLVQAGADVTAITQSVYFSNSPSKVRLLGTALSNIQMKGEIAWTSLSQHELQHAGATVEDCEGVVNFLIAIAGIRAAALLREVAPSDGAGFRLSLRSKGEVDVARVAESFHGGGHRNASGCSLTGNLPDVTRRIISQLQVACDGARISA